MKKYIFCGVIVACLLGIMTIYSTNIQEIVIIIPSYNNSRWYKQNLDSIFMQKKVPNAHVRIIYIDDCSTDGTGEYVEAYVHEHGYQDRITIIHNAERKGALANLYDAIHSCVDRAIMVTVDGDDCLKHDRVLEMISKAYEDPNVWLTYGQLESNVQDYGQYCREIPATVIEANSYRSYAWVTSHLRTFRAGLFKKIKREDLQFNGKFFMATWDQAFMFPMLEMAAGRWKCFTSDVLYVYNEMNPISDFRARAREQAYYEQVIRARPKYQKLSQLT